MRRKITVRKKALVDSFGPNAHVVAVEQTASVLRERELEPIVAGAGTNGDLRVGST
jgi:hypothetical protein